MMFTKTETWIFVLLVFCSIFRPGRQAPVKQGLGSEVAQKVHDKPQLGNMEVLTSALDELHEENKKKEMDPKIRAKNDAMFSTVGIFLKNIPSDEVASVVQYLKTLQLNYNSNDLTDGQLLEVAHNLKNKSAFVARFSDLEVARTVGALHADPSTRETFVRLMERLDVVDGNLVTRQSAAGESEEFIDEEPAADPSQEDSKGSANSEDRGSKIDSNYGDD